MVLLQRITYILINTINFLEFKDSLKEKKERKYAYIYVYLYWYYHNIYQCRKWNHRQPSTSWIFRHTSTCLNTPQSTPNWKPQNKETFLKLKGNKLQNANQLNPNIKAAEQLRRHTEHEARACLQRARSLGQRVHSATRSLAGAFGISDEFEDAICPSTLVGIACNFTF